MGWIEFAALVGGLFATDSRVRRRFAPVEQPDETPSPTEGA